jgi:hypothetical protein
MSIHSIKTQENRMMFRKVLVFGIFVMLVFGAVVKLSADGTGAKSIVSKAGSDKPEFDLVLTRIERFGSKLIFHQVVSGEAGKLIPEKTGKLAGADVYSYVWPTSLDSEVVGFEPKQGILALVVTSHPDFDDTPMADEDKDGDAADDGALWHSHWVVLVADEACGKDGLKVKDIPEGESPKVPATWPKLPLLIDSPNYEVELQGHELVVMVPHSAIGMADTFNFDGVTAGLRINANMHSPLLCVSHVNDIASGNLTLPGVAN